MSSRNTVLFFKKLESVYPYEEGIEIVQTDNGSEFLGEFDKYLKEKGIKHNFIYPRCPRINGYIERANRTLQDEFINDNIFLLADDIDAFNRKLMDYLIWYNTQRPHKSLNNLTPTEILSILSGVSNICNSNTRSSVRLKIQGLRVCFTSIARHRKQN